MKVADILIDQAPNARKIGFANYKPEKASNILFVLATDTVCYFLRPILFDQDLRVENAQAINDLPGQQIVALITRMAPKSKEFSVVPAKFLNTHFTQNQTAQSGRSSLGGRRRKSTRCKTYRKYKKHYSRKYKK